MRILGKAWKRWLKIAEIIGNVQMVVLLSLIYWVMVSTVAVPFKLLADPLTLRPRGQSPWLKRRPAS